MSSSSPLALSPGALLRKMEQDDREIERLLNIYHDERAAQMNRRSLAEEQYEKEIREIADLDKIDADLERIEAEQHGVDHNIMRLTHTTFYSDSDDNEHEEDDEDDLEIEVTAKEMKKKNKKRSEPQFEVQMRTNHREPPSFEIKEGMREALFGYMEASREDEKKLEMEYEALKETGGCVAEKAADRLYETQKANAATLLNMIKEYYPQGSGVVWGNDEDFHRLVKKLNLVV